ncbi:MAG: hypothetical protein ISQ06_13875 [Planctomycetaceae bacterium]|jgi:hypothetical protein|nr:hypothetical protein [Planctomycetaceae bacterium]
MNDPRDFLALAQFGNLGALLLGMGLLGVLIHRKPIRLAFSICVGLLGILFLSEGGALFHGATISVRGSVVAAVVVGTVCIAALRLWNSSLTANRKSK